MTNDIDCMLRDLEKQVQEFTMTMSEHQVLTESTERRHGKQESSSNQDNVPLQVYKTRAIPLQQQYKKETVDEQDDCRDDDICIGSILQRSATARRPTIDKPISNITQSRSLRSTSGRNKTKRDEIVPPVPTQEDEELRFAMQRVWAVLDADSTEERVPTAVLPPPPPPLIEGTTDVDRSNMVSTGRIQTVPLKTLTTRIYIDDAKTHKVVQLTNLLTTAMVVQYLKKKGLLDNSDDWTLFEIAKSHGVERPLREWEIVLDIVSIWEPDASNALLVKKYSYHSTLTSECVLQKKISPMRGWISIEYKKGKWQKRYCFVKDNAIHHAKDNNKGSSTSILCHLGTYDVYTLLQPLKQSPTPFVFAIRAQDRASMFEREGDYMRCLAVEDQEEMKDWVLSIRSTKSNIQYQYHPNRVLNPLAHISLEPSATSDEPTTIRRHKSTRELSTTNKLSDEHTKHALPRSESTRRIDEPKRSLTRIRRNPTVSTGVMAESNTVITSPTDAPLIDYADSSTFAKGSLLAKEEHSDQMLYRQQQQQLYDEQQQSKLIHIDDRIKFAKGSLLDKNNSATASAAATSATPPTSNNKMTRSKSVREVSSSNTNEESSSSRRHVSLRRKPTNKKHHDVPLPNNTPINNSISSTPPLPPPAYSSLPSSSTTANTLLRLDDTPERFHSRELHGRHVKPLLNFDSNERPTTRK
ncbi:hypothetical protein HPULCUR_007462 [Helicostylum pulchrum]|uniref:PH domain-containing protein n=1 Tax=Helicostylum pulchrum TaxID=562976 RepID=A0ABP9Y4X1_9FUNG